MGVKGMAKKEEEIKLIAYTLWEEEGCPDGKDCEHWFRAEIIWERQNAKAAPAKPKIETKNVVQKPSQVKPAKKKS
jgi:hypothetical protein